MLREPVIVIDSYGSVIYYKCHLNWVLVPSQFINFMNLYPNRSTYRAEKSIILSRTSKQKHCFRPIFFSFSRSLFMLNTQFVVHTYIQCALIYFILHRKSYTHDEDRHTSSTNKYFMAS